MKVCSVIVLDNISKENSKKQPKEYEKENQNISKSFKK